jgi:hypothetical protein
MAWDKIPTESSGCNEWRTWYLELRKEFKSNKEANRQFERFWEIRGDKSCANNQDFVDFFNKYGIDVSTGGWRFWAYIKKMGKWIVVILFVILIIWLSRFWLPALQRGISSWKIERQRGKLRELRAR